MNSTGFSKQSQPLHGMFTAVPPRYDLVNHIITLGMDHHWRQLAARICLEVKTQRFLDLGCGTGDLAIAVARMARNEIEITGLDFSSPMLARAREKAATAGVEDRVKFVEGDATRLPFPDGHLDCVGISFAFRNLTYNNPLCQPHLAEVKRVLKPGGRYVIVESSQPKNKVIKTFFHIYLRIFVQPVGTVLSSNRGAYHYLAESAARYYNPEEVRNLLMAAGFRDVRYRPLFFGAAGIHVAMT